MAEEHGCHAIKPLSSPLSENRGSNYLVFHSSIDWLDLRVFGCVQRKTETCSNAICSMLFTFVFSYDETVMNTT